MGGGTAEQFAETKTGVEMIARAGGDLRFGRERAFDNESSLRPVRQGISRWMNHDGIDLQPQMDVAA